MDAKKNKPLKNNQDTENKKQIKKPATVIVKGDIKKSSVIVGDNNKIDNSTTNNFITNIIQNASYKQLIIFGFLIVIFIGIALFAIYHNFFRYDRAVASGQLNILIVPFLKETSWGYLNDDLGWSVAQILTDGVRKEFEDSGLATDIKVLGPADKVPKSYAFTEEQLVQSIETTAEKLNAQITIYGVISEDEYGDSIVRTIIYISPTNFGEAQELISDSIVGELSLGTFRLNGDVVSGSDLLAQNKELRDRLIIYSSIINFLGAYLGEDFERADEYITQAADESLWSNSSGLEVVYLIQGNMEIRRARVAMVNEDLDTTLEILDLAQESFERSTATTMKANLGRYARAYLGLAGVESLRANVSAFISGDPSLIDSEALERALDYLETAQDAEYQPETADVLVKVNYIKAQTALSYYLLKGETEYLSEARVYYQAIIDEYKRTNNKRITELVALSHSGIGHIAREEGEYEIAVEHFLSAQGITANPSLKVQCLVYTGDIYFEAEDYQKALKYYQDAILRRNDLEKAVSVEKIIEIEDRIKMIKGGEQL